MGSKLQLTKHHRSSTQALIVGNFACITGDSYLTILKGLISVLGERFTY